MTQLIQITAPYFCAGLMINNERVLYAAPIIHYMVGWSVDSVIDYCLVRHWTCRIIE